MDYEATQDVARNAGSGRPRKTTKQEDRRIVRSVANNRRISSPQILEENGITNISDRTTRRRIKEDGKFQSYWATKTPWISPGSRKERVA